MLSTRNSGYGRGLEIIPGTYRQPDATDDKINTHFHCDGRRLLALHRGLNLISAFDAEQTGEGSFHWHCLFEVDPDSAPS
jgi:tellurite methyltransferase